MNIYVPESKLGDNIGNPDSPFASFHTASDLDVICIMFKRFKSIVCEVLLKLEIRNIYTFDSLSWGEVAEWGGGSAMGCPFASAHLQDSCLGIFGHLD